MDFFYIQQNKLNMVINNKLASLILFLLSFQVLSYAQNQEVRNDQSIDVEDNYQYLFEVLGTEKVDEFININSVNKWNTIETRNNNLYLLDSVVLFNDAFTEVFQYDEKYRVNTRLLLEDGDFYSLLSVFYSPNSDLVIRVELEFETDGVRYLGNEYDYSYNNNNQLEEVLFTRYTSSGEINFMERSSLQYNESGDLVELNEFLTNDDYTEVLTTKIKYLYDSEQRLMQRNNYTISWETNGLIHTLNYKYKYDLANRIVERTFFNPSTMSDLQINKFEYDENDNLKLNTFHHESEPVSRITNSDFNLNIPIDDLVYPRFVSYEGRMTNAHNGQLRSVVISFLDEDGEVERTNTTDYFWSPVVFSGAEISDEPEDIQFYPNPVSDILNLQVNDEGLTIEIYDLLGDKHFEKKNVEGGDQRIDVSLLSSGMYFFTLQDEKQMLYTGKFIKE